MSDGASTDDRPVPGQGLRRKTVRGTIVNGTFLIGANGLAVIRGFIVATLLATTDFGVWGILVGITTTLLFFKRVGFGDKFVQQNEADQEAEFQRMMTLELSLGLGVMAIGAAALPFVAMAYNTNEILAPGYCMLLELPALALQAPVYLFYRRMDFVKQRTLQLADPIVGFIATVALAFAGLGYWSLVIGTLLGGWIGALVILRACPYKIRWHFDRDALGRYTRFTGPLVLNGLAGLIIGQAILLVAQHNLGLAAVGMLTLSATITAFARRADDIITNTLYPAICAAIDRKDILLESFIKSNRLVVMAAVPFGVGLALFASDLVHFGIGEKWAPAIVLLQLAGLAAAIHQIGFNWDAFYRASGNTRPITWAAAYGIVACLGTIIPLLVVYGLEGAGWGLLLSEVLLLGQRTWYLRQFFPGFRMWRHVVRAVLPSIPAAAVILIPRSLGVVEENLAEALAAVGVYLVATFAFTALIERDLLGEVLGHLRRRKPVATASA